MPPTSAPVLKAGDLRLVHACVKIARVKLQRAFGNTDANSETTIEAMQALVQAETIVYGELCKHNLVPALSAQELRDEDVPEDEIPIF